MRQINKNGLNLIKSFEGLRLKAYPDPGTGGAPWTIGYGHTGTTRPGDVISAQQAIDLLVIDLHEAEEAVNKLCGTNVNDNQFAACVSFAFNCGIGAFKSSTLLKRILAKDKTAADEFLKWNKANGRVMPGLTRRRQAERSLFNAPVKTV